MKTKSQVKPSPYVSILWHERKAGEHQLHAETALRSGDKKKAALHAKKAAFHEARSDRYRVQTWQKPIYGPKQTGLKKSLGDPYDNFYEKGGEEFPRLKDSQMLKSFPVDRFPAPPHVQLAKSTREVPIIKPTDSFYMED